MNLPAPWIANQEDPINTLVLVLAEAALLYFFPVVLVLANARSLTFHPWGAPFALVRADARSLASLAFAPSALARADARYIAIRAYTPESLVR